MQSHKSARICQGSKLGLLIICLVSIVVSLCFLQVESQFFTKTTNSIPRMGRRSLADGQYVRHAIIDRLVDEYGPSLLEAYKAGGLSSEKENQKALEYRNEPTTDWLQRQAPVDAYRPSNGQYM